MAHGASRGLQMARAALDKSELTLGDFISAIDTMREAMAVEDEQRPYSAFNALTQGEYAALPAPSHRRKRDASPQRRPGASSSSAAPPQAQAAPAQVAAERPEHSYNTVAEWIAFAGNKQALTEQLNKRPEWRELTNDLDSVEMRNKMKKMTREDMAKMLMKLDERAGV
jgi:hypothetical protein